MRPTRTRTETPTTVPKILPINDLWQTLGVEPVGVATFQSSAVSWMHSQEELHWQKWSFTATYCRGEAGLWRGNSRTQAARQPVSFSHVFTQSVSSVSRQWPGCSTHCAAGASQHSSSVQYFPAHAVGALNFRDLPSQQAKSWHCAAPHASTAGSSLCFATF